MYPQRDIPLRDVSPERHTLRNVFPERHTLEGYIPTETYPPGNIPVLIERIDPVLLLGVSLVPNELDETKEANRISAEVSTGN